MHGHERFRRNQHCTSPRMQHLYRETQCWQHHAGTGWLFRLDGNLDGAKYWAILERHLRQNLILRFTDTLYPLWLNFHYLQQKREKVSVCRHIKAGRDEPPKIYNFICDRGFYKVLTQGCWMCTLAALFRFLFWGKEDKIMKHFYYYLMIMSYFVLVYHIEIPTAYIKILRSQRVRMWNVNISARHFNMYDNYFLVQIISNCGQYKTDQTFPSSIWQILVNLIFSAGPALLLSKAYVPPARPYSHIPLSARRTVPQTIFSSPVFQFETN